MSARSCKRLAVILLVSGLVVLVSFFIPGNAKSIAVSLPSAVPPEPYPFSDRYPAKIDLTDPLDYERLIASGIDIGELHPADPTHLFPAPESPFEPLIATVYINDLEADRLAQLGLQAVPIPNEGWRAYRQYGPGSGAPDAWPTYDEFVTRMQNITAAYTETARLISIGTSVQGRPIWALKISDNPDVEEDEPEFKYSAAVHGDETVGIEITLRLAELLLSNYGFDPYYTNLVNEMEIWLIPIHNPDGYAAGSRYNAHGQDLNRDFPDRITDPNNTIVGREPETQAFMLFGFQQRFVMGVNYHGGSQVVNVPWDSVIASNPDYAPDDAIFLNYGVGYSSRNPMIWTGGFPNGITRGWEWYIIRGGMQDWAYHWEGEHHVTIELSFTKSPPYDQMDTYWNANRDAMLWWMERALDGVRGRVLNALSGAPVEAAVDVDQIQKAVFTDPDVGDYHRLLLPGTYTLTASAPGYLSQSLPVTVTSGITAEVRDFMLVPLPDLSLSEKTASAAWKLPGEALTYQIVLRNAGIETQSWLTDTLPADLTWSGVLSSTQGVAGYANGQVTWSGNLAYQQAVTLTYGVTLNQCLPGSSQLINSAEIREAMGQSLTRAAVVQVTNDPPAPPTAPQPPDGSHLQPLQLQITWISGTELNCESPTYSLAFGTTSPPPLFATDLVSPTFDLSGLLPDTTYYWQVIASDGISQTAGEIWQFTTQPAAGLNTSFKEVSETTAAPGSSLVYTLTVSNTGAPAQVMVTDTLPVSVTWNGYLSAASGNPLYNNGQIFWETWLDTGQWITMTYGVTLHQCLPAGMVVNNVALLDDAKGLVLARAAQFQVENTAPPASPGGLPQNGAADQSFRTTLSWQAPLDDNCDRLTYSLAFGINNPPEIVVTDLEDSSFDPGFLQPHTTYYWQVIVSDGFVQTPGSIWQFTTQDYLNFLPLIERGVNLTDLLSPPFPAQVGHKSMKKE